MAATPSFANTPRCVSASIVTANAARDGTGTLGSLIAAGASGSVVTYVRIMSGGTVTAGVIRLFMGSILIAEFLIPATTPNGTTVQAYGVDYVPPVPIPIPNGTTLKVGTNNAEQFYVTSYGYDY